MFTVGTIVNIKDEFLNSENEKNVPYVIKEFNGDRCIIAPINWKGYIVPTELVRTEMLVSA